MYAITENDSVRRLSDGAIIPIDEGNRDYVAYLEWIADGNEPAPYVAPPPAVPQQVSPYQARMALHAAGLLDDVEALMADATITRAAKIAWEYATTWQRDSQFIAELAPALGLSEAQIDDLFIAAAQVT